MRDSGGAGLTFAVATEELQVAAAAVEAVTATAKGAVVETLPTVAASLGDEELGQTLADFCARWDAGLSHLVGDSEEMSRRLRVTAATYLQGEQTTVDAYARAVSGVGRSTPWWGGPGGSGPWPVGQSS